MGKKKPTQPYILYIHTSLQHCFGKPHSLGFKVSSNSQSTAFHCEVKVLDVCEQWKWEPENLIKSILQQEAVCWVRRDLFPMLLQAYLSSWEEPY